MKKLGFHYQGAAHIDSSGRIWTRGDMGILIDGYAPHFEHVWLLIHEVEKKVEGGESRTDYCIMSPNVGLWSLGPAGSARDYWKRKRTIRYCLKSCESAMDVVLCRVPSRRESIVQRCLRKLDVRIMICGDWLLAARQVRLWSWRGIFARIRARAKYRGVMRYVRHGRAMVNSPFLKRQFERMGLPVYETRTGILSERDYRQAPATAVTAPWRLLYVGRIAREKGIMELLAACGILRDQNHPIELILVGGGGEAERAWVEAEAGRLGIKDHLRWHGSIRPGPELWNQYAEAHILVFPSHFESLPRAVCEAMGLSLPVVATPVGALPQMFEHERDLLFAPIKNAAALADAIVRVCMDKELREKMISNAYDKALNNSLEKNIIRTVEFLNKEVGAI